MKHHCTFALLLILAGCAADPTIDQAKPKPHPAPSGSAVEDAAAKSIRDYALGVADAADQAASDARTGKAKSYAEIYGSNSAANKKARETAAKGYSDALNAALPPDQPYDQAKADATFSAAAKGFRRGAGQ